MLTGADVYWNSTRRLFSIRVAGKVVGHAASLIVEDPIFLVNPNGRTRVRQTGTKEVHAVIRGRTRVCGRLAIPPDAKQVFYNPFCDQHFREQDTNRNVLKRDVAFFSVADDRPAVFAI